MKLLIAYIEIIAPLLKTAEGRAKLITSCVESARVALDYAASDRLLELPEHDIRRQLYEDYRNGGFRGLAEQADFLQAILAQFDGTEVYDKVAVRSLLADMRSIAEAPEAVARRQANPGKPGETVIPLVTEWLRERKMSPFELFSKGSLSVGYILELLNVDPAPVAEEVVGHLKNIVTGGK